MNYNNTTRFLLPAVYQNFSKLVQNGFINTYLEDHDYLEATGELNVNSNLFLLFKPKKFTVAFDNFCKELAAHEYFLEEYDLENNHVMFRMKFPVDKYPDVIENFKKGAYSSINPKFTQDFFPKFITGQFGKTISKRWQILTKDEARRISLGKELSIPGSTQIVLTKENELWSKPSAEQEIYKFNPEIHKYDSWGM